MITFKQYLVESRSAPLYHGTDIVYANTIIQDNRLNVGYQDPRHPTKNNRMVSLTRDLIFALNWSDGEAIVFELDQQKLSYNYKIRPFSYFKGRQYPDTKTYMSGKDYNFDNQSEEYVDRNITNLSNYIRKVIITRYMLQQYQKMETLDKRTYNNHYKNVLTHPLLYLYEEKRFINK